MLNASVSVIEDVSGELWSAAKDLPPRGKATPEAEPLFSLLSTDAGEGRDGSPFQRLQDMVCPNIEFVVILRRIAERR